ncbi:lamin tail domain-containing protein [Streptomyces sp. NPDC001177]
MVISDVQYDSPGRDDRSNRSLNKEWIDLTNTTRRAVNLDGWTLSDEDGRTYTLRHVRLDGRAAVRVHTGVGRDSRTGRRAWQTSGPSTFPPAAASVGNRSSARSRPAVTRVARPMCLPVRWSRTFVVPGSDRTAGFTAPRPVRTPRGAVHRSAGSRRAACRGRARQRTARVGSEGLTCETSGHDDAG